MNDSQLVKNQIINLLETFISQDKYKNLSHDEKEKFKNELLINFNKKINTVIISNIPSQLQDEFMKILERDDEIETQNFINQHIPNAKELLEKEAQNFFNTILSR